MPFFGLLLVLLIGIISYTYISADYKLKTAFARKSAEAVFAYFIQSSDGTSV